MWISIFLVKIFNLSYAAINIPKMLRQVKEMFFKYNLVPNLLPLSFRIKVI